jgi:hypothetical protein
LDDFGNKVIHRAELIVHKVPSTLENAFVPPVRLFLDRVNNARDSAFLLHNDVPLSADGSIGLNTFGGNLRTDNTYRFVITRHVQGIVTRKEPNQTLRLYAPLRASVFVPGFPISFPIPVNNAAAFGRVVVAGGNYTVDPTKSMRLRIIYSNL